MKKIFKIPLYKKKVENKSSLPEYIVRNPRGEERSEIIICLSSMIDYYQIFTSKYILDIVLKRAINSTTKYEFLVFENHTKDMTEKEIEEQIYLKREFLACLKCREKFLKGFGSSISA